MTIKVYASFDLERALVYIDPGWFDWLLGMRPRCDIARRMGPGEWVWDSPFGGPITIRRVVKALERERSICEISERTSALRKRISELQRGAYP